jgi:hypothetical protein
MKKDYTFWTTNDWFGEYYYGFCPSVKAWQRTFKNIQQGNSGIPPYPSSHACTYSFDSRTYNVKGPCSVVTVIDDKNRSPTQVAGLLVHEAVHIKQLILRSAGEDNVGDETEAYLVQRIAQDLMVWYTQSRVV